MTTYDSLRKALLAPIIAKTAQSSTCLSTGSILLDKMLAVDQKYAIRRGDTIWFHGSSGTCRTFLANQVLAEAANNGEFKWHRMFYDHPMGAFPHSSFGEKHRQRVLRCSSRTVEDWVNRLHETVCEEQAVYVLDSINALQGDDDTNHQYLNSHIRDITKAVKTTQSVLLFISDTTRGIAYDTSRTLRDVPDIVLHFENVKEEQAKYSMTTDVLITVQKRPSLSNFMREHIFSFIPDYGIDDAKACFQFLLEHHAITLQSANRYTSPRLKMPSFTFDEFVDEFDDLRPLIYPLLT